MTLLPTFLRSGLRRLVSLNVLTALSLLLGIGLGGIVGADAVRIRVC